MYRCARIQGLDTAEGLLLFGREHFYILDGFTLVNGKEVHDIDFIPANRFEPLIPGTMVEVKSQYPSLISRFSCPWTSIETEGQATGQQVFLRQHQRGAQEKVLAPANCSRNLLHQWPKLSVGL